MDLPLSYTELYGLAKSPHASAAAAEGAATGHETDPAVCLVCGQVSESLLLQTGYYHLLGDESCISGQFWCPRGGTNASFRILYVRHNCLRDNCLRDNCVRKG